MDDTLHCTNLVFLSQWFAFSFLKHTGVPPTLRVSRVSGSTPTLADIGELRRAAEIPSRWFSAFFLRVLWKRFRRPFTCVVSSSTSLTPFTFAVFKDAITKRDCFCVTGFDEDNMLMFWGNCVLFDGIFLFFDRVTFPSVRRFPGEFLWLWCRFNSSISSHSSSASWLVSMSVARTFLLSKSLIKSTTWINYETGNM